MPSTSPYQNDDYQAQEIFRPYKLPVNDIFKANSAIDQFWDDGARDVKNVYDNALNLRLSLAPNKEIKNQFMQQAEQQITKLSSMNLADPSVQRQGFGIFKPLLQDQGIISDNAATLHIDKVNSDALHFRDTKDGKGYSIYNHQYALLGANEFKNSKDRMAGKAYLEKAKDYEPYYDYSAEAASILKNCHPNKIGGDIDQGLNIVSYSDKGLSSAKLNGCLGSGLSEKAKRQLQIEGAVTYNNNPQALRDAYLPSLQNSSQQLSEENAAYDGLLKNRDNFTSMTESQLQSLGLTRDTKANPKFTDVKSVTSAMLDGLEQKKNANQLQITNLNGNIVKLLHGDMSPISGSNFESVASHVYTKGWMDNYSNANQYMDYTTTTKGNPSQMLMYKERSQDLRQEDQQTFLEHMEDKKLDAQRQLQLMKNKNGGIFMMTPEEMEAHRLLNTAFGDKDIETTNNYDKITQERNNIVDAKDETNTRFLGILRNDMNMPENVVSDQQFRNRANDNTFQNWYNTYTKGLPPTNPLWQKITQYEDKINGLVMKGDLLKNNQDAIDKDLKKTNPDLYDRSRIANLKPVTVDNHQVTANDFRDALEGSSPLLKIVRGDKSIPVYKLGKRSDIIDHYEDAIYMNGKLVAHKDPLNNVISSWIGPGNAPSLLNQVDNITGNAANELSSKRNDLAKTKTIIQKDGYLLPELDAFDPKTPDNFKGRMMQALGLTEGDENAFTVGQTDLKGNVEVTIHPPTSTHPDYNQNDLETKFEKVYQSRGLITPLEGDKYHFVISGFDELNKANDAGARTSDYIAPYVRSLESRVLPNHPESTGLIRSSRIDKQYEMKISSGVEPGIFDYKIQDEKGNIVGIYNDRETALQKFTATINNYKK